MARETAVRDAMEQPPPVRDGRPPAGLDTVPGDADGGTLMNGGSPQIDATRLRVAIARLSRRLTPTQLSALATVEQAGPLRLGDVAAVEGIAPSTLTRIVTALEECAYVKRCAVPGDARASTLAITPRGHEVLERIRQEGTAMLAESLTMLGTDQIEALARAVPALEQLAEVDPRESRTR